MSYLGLDNFCDFSIGAGATAAFGNCVADFEPGGDFKHNEGSGGQDEVLYGMLEPKASIKSIYKGEALLLNCQRATYRAMPTPIHLVGGVLDMPGESWYMNGYVNHLKLSGAGVGDPVKVDYDLLSTIASQATLATCGTPSATAPFSCQFAAVTVDGVACACQSWEMDLDNGLKHRTTQDVKTAGVLRVPQTIDLGNEAATAKFTVDHPPNYPWSADTPSMPITASVKVSNGFTAWLATFIGYCKPFGDKGVAGDTQKTWDLDCEARLNARRSAGATAFTVATCAA